MFNGVIEPGKYMNNDQQDSLQNLGGMVARIRAMSETGRLALRNTARMGTLHLYFKRGQLVHLEGSRSNPDDALIDLAGWSEAVIRFDAGVLPERQTVTPAQQDFFQRTLLLMQRRGAVRATPHFEASFPAHPERPAAPTLRQPVPEQFAAPIDEFLPPRAMPQPVYKAPPGSLRDGPGGSRSSLPSPTSVGVSKAEVLLSARQWELLVEVMHTIVESVGQLFGQQQAQNILQHVLRERSEESEALSLLQVDRQGWLRELRAREMTTQPVREVATAFVLLISDFERRCAALLGEEKARQIIGRALYPYHNDLAEIGIALN